MLEEAGRLRDAWYAAGTTAEIRSKRPVQRVILGQRLVLWRTQAGRALAFSDRCLHRNAPLSAGDLFDDCIGCPYHGWVYDSEGKLVTIPAQAASDPVPDLHIRTWPVTERYGLVWVWMGESEPTGEPFSMPYWDTEGWQTYYMVTEFDNGVTQLAENFMDVPHTVFVHKGWFRNESRTRVDMTVERTDSSVLVTYHQPDDQIGFTSRILNPRGEPMVHTDRFYMPNTTRVDYHFGTRGFVITSTITPEERFKSRVYTLISYNLGSRRIGRLLKPFLRPYTRKVIQQDVDIMAIQGANLAAHPTPHFHHSEADLHHLWIELLRDGAEADQDPPPGETRDATFYI